jgi:Gas vesicle protein K
LAALELRRVSAVRDKVLAGADAFPALGAPLRPEPAVRGRVEVDPEKVERGLAQLVLTLVELLRQLMERQALRRVETGTLDDDEVERLGRTFMLLERRMDELKREFGLRDEDLNLRLGPLGDLL